MRALILALAAAVVAWSPAGPRDGERPAQAEGYYAFLAVDGVWHDNTAYVGLVIRYPGWEACGRVEDYHFFRRASQAFSDHLQAHHTEHFRYGAGNNIQVFNMPQHSTSSYLETAEAARLRRTQWIADQRAQGHRVVETSFSFSCSAIDG